MKFLSKFALFLSIFFGLFLVLPSKSAADDTITDWIIRDFQSEIVVNRDSSLSITENIIADCGDLPDKHGIFRTLSTQYQKTAGESIKTPIELISITDFYNNPLKYSTTEKPFDHTLTWKIGDKNKTVNGLNNYKITYKVKNAIRFQNSNFDELYWNLNGNFWDIETDNFSTKISFPAEVNETDTKINLYSGPFGDKSNNLTSYQWTGDNTLKISSTSPLKAKEGITLSVTFPKNIFTPYKPTFFELYGLYFFLVIPLLILIYCYITWKHCGDDPNLNPTVAPEFEIPDKMSPLDMGLLYGNGQLNNHYLSASIVNLAVNKYIKIEEIAKKGILGQKDYNFILLNKKQGKDISLSEQKLLNKIFGSAEEKKLSTLKNKFYEDISEIKDSSMEYLYDNAYLEKKGMSKVVIFVSVGIFFLAAGIILSVISLGLLKYCLAALLPSAIIFFVFAAIMPKRTLKGATLYRRILGLKLYVEKAEKYRQQFNEKENIFERFLPYAIMFGMTKKWIRAMKQLYGEKYFNTYHPYWYYGYAYGSFDFNDFTNSIDSMSSSMASTLSSNPSSSGSGGGGFSGGGGGGGGGGGW
ncbi:MAG: DUF2207 domain-containing protein [bacterium]|nr:DUF2207 domain-containing protein [bacterium]